MPALTFTGAPARAQQQLIGMQTPSGKIHCMVIIGDGPTNMRCDVLENTAKVAPRPKDCELDYGSAFAMNVTGRASRVCAGDTVADPKNPVVAYGIAWTRAGITCFSAPTGLTCTNRSKHGFTLSRAAQKLF